MEVFGRHIIFDCSSTATRVNIPVEILTVDCFLIEVFRLQGLLNARTALLKSI